MTVSDAMKGKPYDLAPGYRVGRPWFLGQQPKPAMASADELEQERLNDEAAAKLWAWCRTPEGMAISPVIYCDSSGERQATTDDLSRLHSAPSIDELLAAARSHVMTPEEREAQRQSWVRGEMAIGLDRDEAEFRRKMRTVSGD